MFDFPNVYWQTSGSLEELIRWPHWQQGTKI